MNNKIKLILLLVFTMALPLLVAWFAYPSHLPPKFGVFPPEKIPGTPGFNALYFAAIALVEIIFLAFLLWPTKFGFQPATAAPRPQGVRKFPWWFWAGGAVFVFFWALSWSHSFALGELIYYAFTPMWWGFIFVVDGLVYYRNAGKSLVNNRPALIFISGVFSIAAWSYFEFFDYFSLGTWYYPNGHMAELPHSVIVALFLVAYSTVWPVVFEWYTLFNSFPKLVARYNQGPKIQFNGKLLFLLGIVVTILFVIWPHLFFWGVWIGPLLLMAGGLISIGLWTPLQAMANGNWSPVLLVALASMFNGFVWEALNFGSAYPDNNPVTNPNYWIYDVPYVNVLHFFSEMPLLGYFGYLPFGLFVWLMYIWGGKIFGWRTDLDLTD